MFAVCSSIFYHHSVSRHYFLLLSSCHYSLHFSQNVSSRQNRTHGKMSFLEMSKHMGRKWKEADEGTRSIFRQIANEGKAKFNKTVCESYKAACNKFCSKPVVQQPSVAFITPRVPLPREFSTDKAVPSPNVMLSPYHSQLGVGELHNMLQNVEWTSGEYAQNNNNGNLYALKNPLKQVHQQVRGYNDVQGIQRLQYVNPVLNNGANTVAAKDLVDRPYSLVDKRDEMSDDEFRRLLNQLDWSRLEGSKSEY